MGEDERDERLPHLQGRDVAPVRVGPVEQEALDELGRVAASAIDEQPPHEAPSTIAGPSPSSSSSAAEVSASASALVTAAPGPERPVPGRS